MLRTCELQRHTLYQVFHYLLMRHHGLSGTSCIEEMYCCHSDEESIPAWWHRGKKRWRIMKLCRCRLDSSIAQSFVWREKTFLILRGCSPPPPPPPLSPIVSRGSDCVILVVCVIPLVSAVTPFGPERDSDLVLGGKPTLCFKVGLSHTHTHTHIYSWIMYLWAVQYWSSTPGVNKR